MPVAARSHSCIDAVSWQREWMVMTMRRFLEVLKRSAVAWNDDQASMLGAALAYYTVFSLAPLLLLAISVASLVVSESDARRGILGELQHTLGPAAGQAIAAMLDNAHASGGNGIATAVGLVTLILGASGVFVQLQDSFNTIWKTAALPRTENVVVHFLRNRLLSFAAVLGTGFLLLVSLIASSVLAALSQWLTDASVAGSPALWQALSLLVSFGFITLMFALLFKLLPDVPVAWRDVWIGALLTAGLFTAGQHLIGLYLGQSSLASTYGAAGSLVVLLVWVYYSSQIVLFGAEVTHAFAETCGSRAGKPMQQEAAHVG
jgi:membrane protein